MLSLVMRAVVQSLGHAQPTGPASGVAHHVYVCVRARVRVRMRVRAQYT